MSTYINYSAAERESFKLVPETCPEVEAAMDKALRPVVFNDAFAAEIFAKNRLPPPDKKTCEAMAELVDRILFMRKCELSDVVLYKGTFPLRAALVRQVERANGMPPGRNRFEEWIEDHQGQQKYRNPVHLEQPA